MHHLKITLGLRRALLLAHRLKQMDGSDDGEGDPQVHVLWSVFLLESRASEILEQLGVTFGDVKLEFPLEGLSESLVQAVLKQVEQAKVDEVFSLSVLDAELLDLTRLSGEVAGRISTNIEAGTEHLLVAILSQLTPVSNWLHEKGLRAEAITGQIGQMSGHSTEAINVDFTLTPAASPASHDLQILRILDVNLNRLREGLRVVEDFCRLAIEHRMLTGLLKDFRHEVSVASTRYLKPSMIAARDTPGDLGTSLTTPSEYLRESPAQIAVINAKRIGESLRTLEEYGKAVSVEFAKMCESLRYRFYSIEQMLVMFLDRRDKLASARLYLLVTEEMCPNGLGPLIRDAMAGGVDVIQLREKGMSDRRLIETAKLVREWTRDAGVLFIVNDRADIAMMADADGVHVGQDEASVGDARKIVGTEKLIGVSTHSIEQARQAVIDGADYLGVGPVFVSKTKTFRCDEFVGLDLVKSVASEIATPWFAIGGIDEEKLVSVVEAGARRVAVSSAICGADDAREATRRLKMILG